MARESSATVLTPHRRSRKDRSIHNGFYRLPLHSHSPAADACAQTERRCRKIRIIETLWLGFAALFHKGRPVRTSLHSPANLWRGSDSSRVVPQVFRGVILLGMRTDGLRASCLFTLLCRRRHQANRQENSMCD